MEDILKDAFDRYAFADEYWGDLYELFEEDIAFRLGDQWPEAVLIERGPDRVTVTNNQLGKFVRQITGDARKNRPRIRVIPTGVRSSVQVAKIKQGLIRHIENRSMAQVAYDTAIDCTATCGQGFLGVRPAYVSNLSFDMELLIHRIEDPLSVYTDPNAKEPCSEDMAWAFRTYWVSKEAFKKDHPEASQDFSAFNSYHQNRRQYWAADDMLLVADYWTVEETGAKLLQLFNGETVLEKDFEKDLELRKRAQYVAARLGVPLIADRRDTFVRKIMCRKINGQEILEETEFKGKYGYIPIIPAYGEEVYHDGQFVRYGIVRMAKDAQRLRNYSSSLEAESIALQPKAPIMVAEGQITGYEASWKTSHKVPYPYLIYRAYDEYNRQLPMPQRAQPALSGAGALNLIDRCDADMQGIIGIYAANLGQISNEVSGKALYARQREGDTGTYHIIDNFANRTLIHLGRVLLDSIPFYYNTERVLTIVDDRDEEQIVVVNQYVMGLEEAADYVINDLTAGDYHVVIGSGQGYASQRAQTLDQLLTFFKNYPPAAQVAGDVIAKLLDFEEADVLARRLRAMLPQHILAASDPATADQAIPHEVIQAIEALKADLEKWQQRAQQLQVQLESRQDESLAKVTSAQIAADAKVTGEQIKLAAKVLDLSQPKPKETTDVQ